MCHCVLFSLPTSCVPGIGVSKNDMSLINTIRVRFLVSGPKEFQAREAVALSHFLVWALLCCV